VYNDTFVQNLKDQAEHWKVERLFVEKESLSKKPQFRNHFQQEAEKSILVLSEKETEFSEKMSSLQRSFDEEMIFKVLLYSCLLFSPSSSSLIIP